MLPASAGGSNLRKTKKWLKAGRAFFVYIVLLFNNRLTSIIVRCLLNPQLSNWTLGFVGISQKKIPDMAFSKRA